MNCRHCDFLLEHIFLDLGLAPASNAYLAESDLCKEEKVFPLKPAEIINHLNLKRPIYTPLSAYGHFGRTGYTWEQTNMVDDLLRNS